MSASPWPATTAAPTSALRTALDHPAAVTALAVLDAVPIGEALARCDARFAARWWHWFFYGQTAKRAERVISADPDAWQGRAGADGGLRRLPAGHPRPGDRPGHDGGLPRRPGPDRDHDDADRRAGRRVACPHPGPVATGDDLADLYGDVLAVWRPLGGRPPRPPLPLRPPHGRGAPTPWPPSCSPSWPAPSSRRVSRLSGNGRGGRRRRCPSPAWARSARGSSPR